MSSLRRLLVQVLLMLSGKSKMEYISRHEEINTYQSVTFSEGKHGSVIVYNHTVRMITMMPMMRMTAVIITYKGD
jgi:hypothetical protein